MARRVVPRRPERSDTFARDELRRSRAAAARKRERPPVHAIGGYYWGYWQLIQDLVHARTTVLLTTQYLDDAGPLAERLAVIDRGRLISEGTLLS
jgi:hypothetical protein